MNKKNWLNGYCDRCGEESDKFKGSIFNTQMCCMKCIEKEQKHPDYNKAREIELEEVKKGNYNFEGIGLPIDLVERRG